jgi:WD40 repeat protein
MSVERPGRSYRLTAPLVILLGLSSAAWPVRAVAQAGLGDITQPIPVVNTGGHSAPVRALVFAERDGSRLLSAGLDKIVNVWSLDGPRPQLSRTIRPRIWRGYAGAIYAMALSPRPDARGQRLLAVAGVGVSNLRGEIGLYRFPGLDHVPTGDVDSQLPAGQPNGHTQPVLCLAFDPDGTHLASGSGDATVRIWDMRARPSAVVLRGHTGPVNALAFTDNGRRAVTGGADGTVRLWDALRGTLLATATPDPARQRPNDPAADAINALATSPDGRWIVIGRENGDLVLYDAALTTSRLLPRGGAGRGAVEALAISPDGTKMAASIVAHALTQRGERPRVECDVEVRALPTGAVLSRVATSTNLVYALAFSPDGIRLAFAGGDAQAVTVRSLADPNRAPVVLAGQGSSIWDVGFAADGRSIGFARRRPDLPGPPQSYEDFDLRGRRDAPFNLQDLSRAVASWGGWQVRPVDPYTLDVLNPQGQGHRLTLDPALDRRWWSYSFLPPAPSHPRPTIAVGCESGVAIYRLDDGRRTRLFAGHNGAVYALAPSPDGLWLATGSPDQTVRFWRLAGCDAVPPLGARFDPAEAGRVKVAEVERRGFAEAMDMKPGDVIKEVYVNAKLQEGTDLKALDALPPNTKIEFLVVRDGNEVRLVTTKRDAPTLSLFPALDREWIVWTPRGHYETSAIGDRKYLGWHRNRLLAGQPTDFFSFDNFEKELRRPDALLRLLETASLDALEPPAVPAPPQPQPLVVAAREPERVVAEDILPQLQIPEPARPEFEPLVIQGAGLPVRIRAASEDRVAGRGLIRAIRVLIDSGRARELIFNPPVPSIDQVVPLNLDPGRHKVSVVAVNDRDKERTESFDVVLPEPKTPKPASLEPPRLVVLSVGAGRFADHGATLPRIPFAVEDARDVAAFLAAPQGKKRFGEVEAQALLGPDATAARIVDAFHALDSRRQGGELGRGDSVFVMIESHFVSFDRKGVVLGADASQATAAPAVPADLIADTLGQLAEYGCTVMLLVDAHHERRPIADQTNRDLIEWTRALYRRNVITFVASIHGPSQSVATRGHGAFAQGVLDAMNVQGRSRLSGASADAFTLDDFRDRVAQNVLALTGRQQHARGYIPDAISPRLPIFDPPTRIQPRSPLAKGE